MRDRERYHCLPSRHLIMILTAGLATFVREVDLEVTCIVIKSKLERLIKLSDVELDRFWNIAPQVVLAELTGSDDVMAKEASFLVWSLQHCGHLDEQCSSESSCNIFNDDNRSIAIAIACSKYYFSAGCSCFCNDDSSNNSSRFKTGPKNILVHNSECDDLDF